MVAEGPQPPPQSALPDASQPPRPPLLDALTDVAGVRVGHAQVAGAGALSGTTVVLAPEGGA
ncbi:P1 family peptidase, partial [Streptomyces evansiae]